MKKFEFKLETLLKLKIMNEKKTKFELGLILNEIHEIKNDISNLNKDIEESYKAYDLFLKDAASSEMLSFFPDFVKTKKDHINVKNNLLYGLDKKYQEKVKELSTKKAEVKVIEGLKDKAEEEYKKIKLRKERETLEEFVSIRHHFEQRQKNENKSKSK